MQSKVGEGSTFTVEIPEGCADRIPEVAPKPPGSPIATPLTAATVLLVDDDNSVSESLALLLETFGMQVHVAASGSEALARIAAGAVPDVLLTDLRLPGYDGLEVIKRVRDALNSHVPAILITGDTGLQSPSRPANFAMLHKPFDIEALVAQIETMRRGSGGKVSPVPGG